jgi:multiple sugar transport system permease protein
MRGAATTERRAGVAAARGWSVLASPGLLFVTPTILVLVLVVALPLVYSLVISFSRFTFLTPRLDRFAGVDNYLKAFADRYFWNSFYVTVKYVVLVVGVEFLLGLLIALLLHGDLRFKGVYYAILTIPMVMSPVGVGLIWKMLLHPGLGVVNYVLSRLGIQEVNWLGSPAMAFWSLLLVDVWQQISFMILVLLAGLVSLPREPFEAAEIDGANSLQRLWYVTVPLLKPVALVAVLIRTIMAFRTYDLVYVMTRGGPGVSTDIISYYIYRTTFMGLDLAQASAVSYLLLVVVLGLTAALFSALLKQEAV